MATKGKGKGAENPKSWRKHMGRKKPSDEGSQANRRVRKAGKKEAKEQLTETASNKKPIIGFINSITRKNYAKANKYLTKIVEDKVRARIGASLNKPLF